MLKKRSKIVNFRVTDDEFTSLKEACSSHGARCLSEYARTTALESAHQSPTLAVSVQTVIDRMSTLEDKLTAMELAAERTLRLLEGDCRIPAETHARIEEN